MHLSLRLAFARTDCTPHDTLCTYGAKQLVIQRFSGFFFFSGYKLATFTVIFVARGSRHNAVKLSGYLHLLVGVQVTVRVHRCLHLFMSEPLRDQQR